MKKWRNKLINRVKELKKKCFWFIKNKGKIQDRTTSKQINPKTFKEFKKMFSISPTASFPLKPGYILFLLWNHH